MRAMYRCKEHSQGDRCTLSAGHTAEKHEGNWLTWTDRNQPERKPEAKYQRKERPPGWYRSRWSRAKQLAYRRRGQFWREQWHHNSRLLERRRKEQER